MQTGRRRVALAAVVWAVVLAGLFMLFTGQWTAVNWIGAGAAGALAAAFTIPLVITDGFHLRFRLRWMRLLGGPLIQIFADFAIVTGALASCLTRGARERGRFVARSDFPAGGRDAEGTAWRGLVAVLATWSPNSYVVDIDAGTGNRLSHDLVPRRASERPA